jgi:hypothetical protein
MWQALVTLGGEQLVAVADVVPVDQFLEWYPGWTPELIDSPWVAEPPGPFTKADEARFWFADFHWPRGFSPLAFVFVTDCSAWGTQSAAHWLPLPAGRGLGVRLGGPFPYARSSQKRRSGRSAFVRLVWSARCRGSLTTSKRRGRSVSGSCSSRLATSSRTTSPAVRSPTSVQEIVDLGEPE